MPAASHAIDMHTAVTAAKAPKPTTAPPPAPIAITAVLDPKSLYEAFLNGAVYKANLPWPKKVLLATSTGIFLAMGSQFMVGTISDGAPTTSPTGPVKMLGGICFSMALMLIYVMGTELFTGNVLMVVAVLEKRISVGKLLKAWATVWTCNFLGAILFAILFYPSGVNGYAPGQTRATANLGVATTTGAPVVRPRTPSYTITGERMCSVTYAKVNVEEPYEVFARAIFANMCVIFAMALMVASRDALGKMVGALLPISLFVVIGGDHSIANMYLFSAATLLDCPIANHGWYWVNLILATAGNIIGAASIGVAFWFAYLHHPDHVEYMLSKVEPPAVTPSAATAGGDPNTTNISCSSNNGAMVIRMEPAVDQKKEEEGSVASKA